MDDERGQVLQDFAVGVSILLVTLAFVTLFLPNLFAPFAGGDTGDSIKTERVADSLIGNILKDSKQSTDKATIDREKTIAFFGTDDESITVDSSIYDNSQFNEDDEIHEIVGLREIRDNVFIQIIEPGETDTKTMEFYSEGDDVSSEPQEISLEAGNTPPTNQNVAVTERVVYINGEPYNMKVYVW